MVGGRHPTVDVGCRVAFLGVLLAGEALLSHGLETKKAPLFQHDSNTISPEAKSGSSESQITYPAYSGVMFLTDETVIEYVLTSKGLPLLNASERQSAEPYNLRLCLYDLNRKEATATKDIPLPQKAFRIFRSRSGNILVAAGSSIIVVSPELSVLRQVVLTDRLRDGERWMADVVGDHLYLIANSTKQCPAPVETFDSESLSLTGSWCLSEDRDKSFYGATVVEYERGKNPTLSIYRAGEEVAKFDVPKMLFTEQVVLLSDEWLVVHDGARLLSYRIGKGVEYYVPVHWSIISPLGCSASETGCAFVMARARSDPFDVRRKTTFKDVAVAVVSPQSGEIQFRCSIRERYREPSYKELSGTEVTLSPTGNRVAIWFGSSWEVYSVH